MDELELLKRLGERLSSDVDPKIDVRARVLGQISRQRLPAADMRLSLCVVGACVLSIVAVMFARPAIAGYDALSVLSDAARRSTGPEAVLQVLEP